MELLFKPRSPSAFGKCDLFDYLPLKQKNDSRSFHPVYLAITSKQAAFYFGGYFPLDGGSVNEQLIRMPYQSNLLAAQAFSRSLVEAFDLTWPRECKPTRPESKQTSAMIRATNPYGYSALQELSGIESGSGTNEEEDELVGRIKGRHLILDLLFELSHGEGFKHSANYRQLEEAFLHSDVGHAILAKAEFYWQRKLWIDLYQRYQRGPEDKSPDYAYLRFRLLARKRAAKNWLSVCWDESKAKVFSGAEKWFRPVEDEVKQVVFESLAEAPSDRPEPLASSKNGSWKDVIRFRDLNAQHGVDYPIRDTIRVSSWFLRRYATNAAVLHLAAYTRVYGPRKKEPPKSNTTKDVSRPPAKETSLSRKLRDPGKRLFRSAVDHIIRNLERWIFAPFAVFGVLVATAAGAAAFSTLPALLIGLWKRTGPPPTGLEQVFWLWNFACLVLNEVLGHYSLYLLGLCLALFLAFFSPESWLKHGALKAGKPSDWVPFRPVNRAIWLSIMLIIWTYLLADLGLFNPDEGLRWRQLVIWMFYILLFIGLLTILIAILTAAIVAMVHPIEWTTLACTLLFPRMVLAIAGAWFVILNSGDLVKTILLVTWQDILLVFSLTSIVAVAFTTVEVHRHSIQTVHSLRRALTVVGLAFLVSFVVGAVITSFLMPGLLEETGYLDQGQHFQNIHSKKMCRELDNPNQARSGEEPIRFLEECRWGAGKAPLDTAPNNHGGIRILYLTKWGPVSINIFPGALLFGSFLTMFAGLFFQLIFQGKSITEPF